MSNYQHERGWLDSDVWENAPYSEREAWSWMIGEASWKDSQKNIGGYPVMILRGQFSHSIRFMATKFQWSVGKVQRFLKKLLRWNMIKTDTATDTAQTIVTICNYNIYQTKRGKTDTATDTDTDTAPIQGRIQTRNPSIQSSQIKEDIYVALESYNLMAKDKNLPTALKLTAERKKKLKVILDEHGIDGWDNCIKKISLSKFLQGENGDRWRADFDFIIRNDKFLKIIEGAYDNNEKPVKKFTGF